MRKKTQIPEDAKLLTALENMAVYTPEDIILKNLDCRKTSRVTKAVKERIQKCFHHYCFECTKRQNS